MSFDVDTLKHTNVLNVDQLYADYPLGTMADLDAVHDAQELQHIELMHKEVLGAQEAMELDLLTDQFVNELNNQMNQIKF
jgi:hypothetical protein